MISSLSLTSHNSAIEVLCENCTLELHTGAHTKDITHRSLVTFCAYWRGRRGDILWTTIEPPFMAIRFDSQAGHTASLLPGPLGFTRTCEAGVLANCAPTICSSPHLAFQSEQFFLQIKQTLNGGLWRYFEYKCKRITGTKYSFVLQRIAHNVVFKPNISHTTLTYPAEYEVLPLQALCLHCSRPLIFIGSQSFPPSLWSMAMWSRKP